MTGAIQTPRDASYDQATLGQLAGTIAERHNLPLAISAALKAEALGHIDQRAESDLALLARLTQPLGAIAKLADQKLIIAHKDQATSVSGKPLPAITLNAAAQGIYIRGTIKGRAKVAQTKAYWQTADMSQKQAITQGPAGHTYTLKGAYSTERAAKAAASAKAQRTATRRGGHTMRPARQPRLQSRTPTHPRPPPPRRRLHHPDRHPPNPRRPALHHLTASNDQKETMIKRPKHPDRSLQSLNDIYGHGVIDAVTENDNPAPVWCYCLKAAAKNQYSAGYLDGLRIKRKLK